MIEQIATLELPDGGGIPMHIYLSDDPRTAPQDTAGTAVTARRWCTDTVSVVCELDGIALDLGVHREGVAVGDTPTGRVDHTHLIRTVAVRELIADYRTRLAELAVRLAGLGLATADAVPIAVSVDDLDTLHHCLTVVARRWREAADDADAAGRHPRPERAPSPGHINIEPTPGGYRLAARLFRAEPTRAEQLGHRVRRLLDRAHSAGAHGDRT
jgi:hypothetical protein